MHRNCGARWFRPRRLRDRESGSCEYRQVVAKPAMTTETVIYPAILSVCTIASGVFSGSETALIGISRERVRILDDGFRCTVLAMDRQRFDRVRVERIG